MLGTRGMGSAQEICIRLRLSIQPADTPHQLPSLPEFAKLVGGMLSIYHDAAHPSAVVLPTLATGD